MKLAVVGCRDLPEQYYLTVKQIIIDMSTNFDIADFTLVTGCASGADSFCCRVGFELDIPVIRHVADWKKYGRAAGPLRNQLIVADADEVACFVHKPLNETRGSLNCVRQFFAAGKSATIYEMIDSKLCVYAYQ